MLDLPSPSGMGPEPLRTEPSRSANFAAAEFREGGTWETVHLNEKLRHGEQTSILGENMGTWRIFHFYCSALSKTKSEKDSEVNITGQKSCLENECCVSEQENKEIF